MPVDTASTLPGSSPVSAAAEKMTTGSGGGVGEWVKVGVGVGRGVAVGVGEGTTTLICTVWLELSSPLNAVRMYRVDFSTEMLRLPCRSRLETLPRSGP